MAIIKCKMCGGELELIPGKSVAECEFCGSVQTVPAADSEKKLTLFARANRLRAACEFDKAAGIYENIVSEFPEEAEAYWGLVLCKYGIEYVDDPATGKKIPTCHRSSFESILEDTDLEQALENTDPVARKVYREEARQIEEIRKGIIAVSANEQPYDIFICYKETDPNGDRTLDSVLAQDVYDALTDKGYRVFFSRISLEDKLGVEYEPYIFAALNSAKIMLVFGTDYEYFNAVWVKNEWSRYLKLMVSDKNKHLIPCFKGIDAYDMPKEFARLQAQDLGKVGAVQDLLRGIEKILPGKQNTTVIQERVVVGGTAGNKIASLLDRGNMALEDGDWAKADSFFEDVLNNDSKNAQAYLGKTLAQEKCRTVDAFARKRKNLAWEIRQASKTLPREEVHIREMETRYALPGYLTENEIRELYAFDLRYSSTVRSHEERLEAERKYWAEHKLLARAEKFAQGAVAESLEQEKQALLAHFAQAVRNAEATEADEKNALLSRYRKHITQADENAARRHEEALGMRDGDYEMHLRVLKGDPKEIAPLQDAVRFFSAQSGYRDSDALAEHCRKRIRDLHAEAERLEEERKAAEAAEAERQRLEAEKAAEEQRIAEAKAAAAKKKKKTIIGIVAVLLVLASIAYWAYSSIVIVPNIKRDSAAVLTAQGRYEEAIAIYQELGEPENVESVKDTAVRDLMDAEDYKNAFLWAHKLENVQQKEDYLAQIGEYGKYLPVDLNIYGGAGFKITYTASGWPSQIVGYDGFSNDDAYSYEYDAAGNVIRCIATSEHWTAQWDFYPGKARFHVDALTHYEDPGIRENSPLPLLRFSGVSHYVSNDVEGNYREEYYDESGLLTQWKETADAENFVTVQWMKDADGVITGWENGRWEADRIVYANVSNVFHDAKGYLTQADSTKISRTYDDQGRITERTVLGENYSYRYDEYGRIIGFSVPNAEGTEVTWKWRNLKTAENLLAEMDATYQQAMELYNAGSWEEAIAKFEENPTYLDSTDKINAAKYQLAQEAFNQGNYQLAQTLFESLDDYENSAEHLIYCQAVSYEESSEWAKAMAAYASIEGFMDAKTKKDAAIQTAIKEAEWLRLSTAVKWLESLSVQDQNTKELLDYYRRVLACEGEYKAYKKINRYTQETGTSDRTTTLTFHVNKGEVYCNWGVYWQGANFAVLEGIDGYDFMLESEGATLCFSSNEMREDLVGYLTIIEYFRK